MKLELRSKGVKLSKKLKQHIEKRVRLTLDRFGDRVGLVHVQLTDVPGSKSHHDIECQIRAQLAGMGSVVIQDLRRNPFSAVAGATARISRSVARQFDRLGCKRRGR